MTPIPFISGEAALRNFLGTFDQEAKDSLEERNINASGALSRSHRVEVQQDGTVTTGTMYALDYWKRAGSGSPPGTVANLDKLKAWLLDKGIIKGLDNPGPLAAIIQENIFFTGSNDWIAQNPNVYKEVAKGKREQLGPIAMAFLRDMRDPIGKMFTAAFKVA